MKLYRIIILSVFILFLVAEGFLFDFTVEDSFTSYRYVLNITDGNAGFLDLIDDSNNNTNPLWAAILMPFVLMDFSIELVSKVLGIVSTILLSLFFFLLVKRHITKNKWQLSSLLTLYLVTNMSILFYSVSGLDTIFYAMLIVALLWLSDTKRWISADIVLLLTIISRPESILLLVPYSIAVFREERFTWISLAIVAPVYLLASYLFFRLGYFSLHYYSTLLSQLFGDGSIGQFVFTNTRVFFTDICLWSLKILGLGSLGVFALTGIVKSWKERLPLFITVLALFLLIWFRGGDWMSFHRLFVPVFAPVLLFAAIGLDGIFRQIEVAKVRKWIFLASVVVLLGMNFSYTSVSTYHLYKNDWYNPAMTSKVPREIGKFFKEYANPWDVVVSDETEALGYFSGLETVSTSLKSETSRSESNELDQQEAYVDQIFKSDPRFILLSVDEGNRDNMMTTYQKAIYSKMTYRGDYSLLKKYDLTNKRKWHIYERNLLVATR